MIDLFSSLSGFLEKKSTFLPIIEYYFFMTPLIISRVSSFALVISVLYTLGELNKDNEIISIRSSGISIMRMSLPIIFLAILLSFAALFSQENILIESQKKAEELKDILTNKKQEGKVEKNLAFIAANKIFFVRELHYQQNILKDVTIFQENKNNNITKKIICKRITYKSNIWWGENVIEYTIDGKGSIMGMPKYWTRLEIPIENTPEELILKKSSFSQYSSLKNLIKDIQRCKKLKNQNLLANFVITFYQKILDPFAHLFLIMGILPFALEIRKRMAKLSALGMGFFFCLIYYVLSSVSLAFGKAGFIMPILAAWVTPLFFITIGIIGLIIAK